MPVIWLPVPFTAFGMIDGAVLGFIIDLDLGVIRAQVALVTGFWLSGLHD
jgi:hypothetical protein